MSGFLRVVTRHFATPVLVSRCVIDGTLPHVTGVSVHSHAVDGLECFWLRDANGGARCGAERHARPVGGFRHWRTDYPRDRTLGNVPRVVATIDASDSYVYIKRGDCRVARALLFYRGHRHRLGALPLGESEQRKMDDRLISLIGAELRAQRDSIDARRTRVEERYLVIFFMYASSLSFS
jgi:hypothetical protein